MIFSIYKKELNEFFSSPIAYISVGVFLLFLGLYMWVFTDTSILDYNYATLDQLFSIGPMIFLFLIPALTMKSFSEEIQHGTLELVLTKPVSEFKLVFGKFLSACTLVIFALIPTTIYYYSVYHLGMPKGNLDSGAIMGSYLGFFMLACVFVSIGMFASSLTRNQIVSFALASFLCFFFYWAFHYLSELPVFVGKSDAFIQKLGIHYHYESISRGVIDSRDILYFFSLIVLFLTLNIISLQKRKW